MLYLLVEDIEKFTNNENLLTEEQLQYNLFNEGIPYMYFSEVEKTDDNDIKIVSIKNIKDLHLWNNYDFCKYVIENYKSKEFVQNEEAKKLNFPQEEEIQMEYPVKHSFELNNELWDKYLKTFNKDLSLRDQVLDMYKHFTIDECKQLYGHYRKSSENIYDEHCSKSYEGEFKDFLISNGVKYENDRSYRCSVSICELTEEHCKLINNLIYKSKHLTQETIFSCMGYNHEDKLNYFKPVDTSPYDKDYYIEHHITEGQICDIKVKYPVITYEEMLYIHDLCIKTDLKNGEKTE
jgi:hypothetical protein